MASLQHRMKLYYWIVAVVSIGSVCIYFLTPYDTVARGFLLGVVACLLSFISIYIKSLVIGHGATKHSMLSYFVTAFGVVIRYGTVAATVALALIFPDTFHFWSVVIGYAGLYIYIMVDMFLTMQKER